MKYRKKPVIVEAVQFTRDSEKEIRGFTGSKANVVIPRCPDGKAFCMINTFEGVMRADEGDYIIKGVQGEFYPCKPKIFEETYEAIDFMAE